MIRHKGCAAFTRLRSLVRTQYRPLGPKETEASWRTSPRMKGALRTRLLAAGPAVAGIVAAHWVAYAVSASDAHEHSHLLDGAHRYFPYLAAIALGVLAFALSNIVSTRFRQGQLERLSFAGTASRFALLQVSGFVMLEAAERLLFMNGTSPSTLLEKPVALGVLLQFVFAAIGAALLLVVAKVADVLASRSTPPDDYPETREWLQSQIARPRLLIGLGAFTVRGPPARA